MHFQTSYIARFTTGDKEQSEIESNPIQTGCKPGYCSEAEHPMHWHQGIVEALEGHIASLEPDAVVLNTGFWDRLPGAMDVARLAAAGHRAVHAKNGLMFFKTTTTGTDLNQVDDAAFSDHIEEYGWRIFDAGGITRLLPGINTALLEAGVQEALYWDVAHYYPQGKTGRGKGVTGQCAVNQILTF